MRLLALLALCCASACAGAARDPLALDTTLGSTENATVALDADDGQRPLLFLTGALTADELAAFPEPPTNLRIVRPASLEEALALAPEAHGIDTRWLTPEFLAAAPQLRWVQSTSAGVDRYLGITALRESPEIVLTNMQGAHGPTIADHVFGMLLVLTRDLAVHLQESRRGEWTRGGSGVVEPVALQGRTLLVLGLGGIGREVARRGKGFGMQVWATKRSATPPPPYVDRQETDPALVPELLAGADVVVLCVPLTEETRGMIDAAALAAMPRGSYLVNIARGAVVDTDALLAALRSGHLGGAALDVTDPEPLPAEHPLWQEPRVVITPHVAGRSALTGDRWQALYFENLRRFAAGEPLLNVVDKAAGY